MTLKTISTEKMEYTSASTDCVAVVKSKQNRRCGFFTRRNFFQTVGSVPKATQAVSTAAKKITLDVDIIVEKASSKKMDEDWKLLLFRILGGSDKEVQMGSRKNSQAYIDILLNKIGCYRFVQICLEHEVPSTLIRCLRLLRVVELQNSEDPTSKKIQRSKKMRGLDEGIPSVTTVATAKVSALLCFFCSGPFIDEHIRPQLIGLLGMIGAPYPQCGQHIATATASIVKKISDSCLSMDLIIYLYDQRVIKNMLRDTKYLLQKQRTGSIDYSNYFDALNVIVHLVVDSCNYRCFRLLNHFRVAKGYQIINFAIETSPKNMTSKMVEFIALLVYCKTEETFFLSTQEFCEISNSPNQHFIPWNKEACAMIEKLIFENVPILNALVSINNGMKPNFCIEQENKDNASFAVDTACKLERRGNLVESTSEQQNNSTTRSLKLRHTLNLLLGLFSSNPKNFVFIESNYPFLAYFILAYPTIEDESIKNKILEILDMSTSWVEEYDSMIPITVGFEVYFALNSYLMEEIRCKSKENNEDTQPTVLSISPTNDTFQILLRDTNKLFAVLEKKPLLQESQRGKKLNRMHLKLPE